MIAKRVYILIGLTGAGQDEFIGTYLSQIDDSAIVIDKSMSSKEIEKYINGEECVQIIVNLGLNTKLKRAKFFRRFDVKADFWAIYFDTPFEQVVINNPSLPYSQLAKEYISLELPDCSENWNRILIKHDNPNFVLSQKFLFELRTEEKIFDNAIFDELYNYEQQKPDLDKNTVSRHMWLVYKELFERTDYSSINERNVTLIAGLFHDMGKPFCHKWSEEKQKYSHTGHDRVGAQMIISLFSGTFSDDFLLRIAWLIGNHMQSKYNPEMAQKSVYDVKGLAKLHEADNNNNNRLRSLDIDDKR